MALLEDLRAGGISEKMSDELMNKAADHIEQLHKDGKTFMDKYYDEQEKLEKDIKRLLKYIHDYATETGPVYGGDKADVEQIKSNYK